MKKEHRYRDQPITVRVTKEERKKILANMNSSGVLTLTKLRPLDGA